jgi:hypothetical protein
MLAFRRNIWDTSLSFWHEAFVLVWLVVLIILSFDYLDELDEEELDGPAVKVLGVQSWKLSNVRKGQSSDGWPKFITSSDYSSFKEGSREACGWA